MKILEFQVFDYKCFKHSDTVQLSPGFNVIVGRNNVGKTALLQLLGLNFTGVAHRSSLNAPRSTAVIQPRSRIRLTLGFQKSELVDLSAEFGRQVALPITSTNEGELSALQGKFDSSENFELRVEYENGSLKAAELIAFGPSLVQETSAELAKFRFDDDSRLELLSPNWVNSQGSNGFAWQIGSRIHRHFYSFQAERFNLGEANRGPDNALNSDASNLAPVLDRLASVPAKLRRFNEAVNSVFPDVGQITVKPINDQQRLQILVWSQSEDMEREDLAVPLNDSGTGIGQVLAILTVVMTSDFPRVIIIDEPQSFLHPGAVRKLFEVMRVIDNQGHQFVISTHSTAALNSVDGGGILMITKEGPESTIQRLDLTQTFEMQALLSEVGVRLSDVFGAENILWVEGKTEEVCFPLIIREVAKIPLAGTVILGLVHTGDLEGRHAELAFQIYDRLSSGTGLIPPALGFVLDPDRRTTTKVNDLKKRAQGKLHLLPRLLYENYLLHPDAIAAVANGIDGFRDRRAPVTAAEVTEWLDLHRWEKTYVKDAEVEANKSDEHWAVVGDGARVLADMFSELSEARVPYDKVKYGLALTAWFVKNDPQHLAALASFLSERIQSGVSK